MFTPDQSRGQRRFEGMKIILLNEQVPGIGITGRQAVVAPQQPVRHFPVVVDYSLLSYPIKSSVGIHSVYHLRGYREIEK